MIKQEDMIKKINNAYLMDTTVFSNKRNKDWTDVTCPNCSIYIHKSLLPNHIRRCFTKKMCHEFHLKQIQTRYAHNMQFSLSWNLILPCGSTSCPFKHNTCHYCETQHREYMSGLHAKCAEVIVKCPNGCGFECSRAFMQQKHMVECENRDIWCYKCGEYVIEKYCSEHVNICKNSQPQMSVHSLIHSGWKK
jgi:hypothetical protein